MRVCSQDPEKVEDHCFSLMTPSGLSELNDDPHEYKIHSKLSLLVFF